MTTSRPAPPDAEASVRVYLGEYAPHSHGHAQVLVGLRGSLALEVGGHGAVIDAASGLLIPAGMSHAYLATTRAEVLVVDCHDGGSGGRLRRFAVPAAWRQGGIDAQALVHELAGLPRRQPRRRLDLDTLDRRVRQQLHRPWTNDELAALCHFSPQRFRARFAECTGLSPMAWVRRLRLDEAERQLAAGVPVDTVALAVGYAGASALCFALRRDRDTGARRIRARTGGR